MKKLLGIGVMLIMFFVINIDDVEANYNELRQTYDLNKSWTITFSKPVDKKSINENTVYIRYLHSDDEFKFTYSFSKDLKKVTVIPLESYTINRKMLLVVENVKSSKGTPLKQNVSMLFAGTSDEPIDFAPIKP